jgi:hypothetical protein
VASTPPPNPGRFSLQQQLQTELLHAVLVANHRGYTPDQIALLLDHAA